MSSNALCINWCDDANTELCITYEDAGGDPTDSSSNAFTVVNDGVTMTTGNPPASYSTYYGDYERNETDDLQVNDTVGVLKFEGATEDFSTSFWFYPETISGNNQFLTNFMDTSGDGWLVHANNSGTVTFYIDAKVTTSVGTLDSKWQYWSFTANRDGNSQVYLDGVATGTPTALSSEVMDITTNTFRIASPYTGGNWTDGLMDEHIITSDILSSTDINDIMDNGLVQAATGAPPQIW